VATLRELSEKARSCTACHLHERARQTVFGEGPADARIVLVGEQPGDQEDRQGRPFVGPAGQILDRALVDGGVDRSKVYVTNAVKHFKFEQRGKRRLHKRPNAYEIERCKWWLDHEREIIHPSAVVALGASAARSLFGRSVTIGKMRGMEHRLADSTPAFVTIHPSYLLRIQDEGDKAREYRQFVADLRNAARQLLRRAA
jgi:uracil-DNA glycosylase